jgi:hypothetical protein
MRAVGDTDDRNIAGGRGERADAPRGLEAVDAVDAGQGQVHQHRIVAAARRRLDRGAA